VKRVDPFRREAILTKWAEWEIVFRMRFFTLPFSLLLIFPSLSALEIETAYPLYHEAGEIRTISDYFGKDVSNQRFRTVVPSSRTEPAGQYFITRLAGLEAGEEIVEARMTLFTTQGKEPGTYTWDLSGLRLADWLYLGLTGEDWPDEDILPLAWKIELLDGKGTLLAEWKSFLWEMP